MTVNQLPKTLSFLPKVLLVPIIRIYVTAKEYVLNTPPVKVVPMQVAGGMGLVFLAWRVGRWEPFMRKWFLHRPVLFSGGVRREWANCVTLFTSVVSTSYPSKIFKADSIDITSIIRTLLLQFIRPNLFRSSSIHLPLPTRPLRLSPIICNPRTPFLSFLTSWRSFLIACKSYMDESSPITKITPNSRFAS